MELQKVYCEASGLKINNDKSSISFSKWVPIQTREAIKLILHVPNETLSEKYLGFPTEVGRLKNGTFRFLKDRLWARIQGWIEKCLFTSGKEVLMKSVAQAIPTFSMSCFKLPRGLCEHLNGKIRKFWWDSKKGERKVLVG